MTKPITDAINANKEAFCIPATSDAANLLIVYRDRKNKLSHFHYFFIYIIRITISTLLAGKS